MERCVLGRGAAKVTPDPGDRSAPRVRLASTLREPAPLARRIRGNDFAPRTSQSALTLATLKRMILETAILNVRPAEEAAFETAMRAAQPLIAATPGFIGLDLHRCIETPNRYLLLVRWRALEDHTVGFRQSDRYREWRALLHHFYDPFPTVEHYSEPVTSA